MNEAAVAFRMDAYLDRVGYTGERTPTREVLEELHLAHATHIPFENLDILLGRPIRLDLESLQAKLVEGRRGGYCFEHNTLFAAVLEQLGFPVTRLAARVRLGATRVSPRTHMLLEVEAEGGPYLADVGFGGEGLLRPLALRPDQVTRQFGRDFRLAQAGGHWVLQSRQGSTWLDYYAFTREPQYPADFEVANHYTSTYPASHFVKTLTAQRQTPEARFVLRGREFTVVRGGEESRRMIEGDESLLQVLSEVFGLHLPPGTRFPGPGGFG